MASTHGGYTTSPFFLSSLIVVLHWTHLRRYVGLQHARLQIEDNVNTWAPTLQTHTHTHLSMMGCCCGSLSCACAV